MVGVPTGRGGGGAGGGGSAGLGMAAVADDPGEEAERFFSRMISPSAWARLTDEARRHGGPTGPPWWPTFGAFAVEGAPFDVTALSMPSVFGMGGPATRPHHRRTVEWLGANVPGGVVYEIEGAQHGAHLSHPDHFATMTRLVIERATRGRRRPSSGSRQVRSAAGDRRAGSGGGA